MTQQLTRIGQRVIRRERRRNYIKFAWRHKFRETLITYTQTFCMVFGRPAALTGF
jgi:hypothetical protein